MAGNDCAILVAINDNHSAWYEMLIPFVLSLRRTDFAGRLVVLGYGLSPAKSARLRDQGIEVVAARPERGLPLGRYVEVAEFCAAHPEIRKAALYDADLWFASPHFDLFSLIDGESLYACPDPLFCQFVISPLIGPRKDENWHRVVTEVLQRHGYALQAGLVAGTAAAWAQFGQHVLRQTEAIGTDLQNCFGIDTTILHLWAATGDLVLLPSTQNFITRWGVAEVSENGLSHFADGRTGTPIRALHMAGNVRFLDRWRYYGNHGATALSEGAAFALSPGGLGPDVAADAQWDSLRAIVARHGLRLTGLRLEAAAGVAVTAQSTATGVTLTCEGTVAITLETVGETSDFNVYMTHPSGFPSPIRRSVTCLGSEAPSHCDLMAHYRYSLPEGAPVTLTATGLGGQLCKSIWFLSDRPFIEQ
ncbi:hypothetical protein [Methylobacterium aerolatum]|uniref:Uncharacterized protein n=1 Tax=Methylobacterium aerolatum TaxID=418708 RepID=A0ABU0I784_9HYPH|nr:hypothetical protein [Methylobacterium aerolatum]MDQ0449755.1 hypothetical protein [Methylobacterium aerolatum]GJD37138.1 hypothetical protein FMGBMHLM_4064 [Methylobacterium aerolatum]